MSRRFAGMIYRRRYAVQAKSICARYCVQQRPAASFVARYDIFSAALSFSAAILRVAEGGKEP